MPSRVHATHHEHFFAACRKSFAFFRMQISAAHTSIKRVDESENGPYRQPTITGSAPAVTRTPAPLVLVTSHACRRACPAVMAT